mgnify:CR=1 FL=1
MKKYHLIILLIIALISSLNAQNELDTIWSTKISDMYDAKITPDNSRIIVASEESILVLDEATGETIKELDYQTRFNYKITISSDSKYLYTSQAMVWDLDTYELILDSSDVYLGKDICLSSDNSNLYIVSSGTGGGLENNRIISLRTSDLSKIQSLGDTNTDELKHYKLVAISNDNKYLVVAGSEEKIIQPDERSEYTRVLEVYDPVSFEKLNTILRYKNEFTETNDLSITEDSKTLIFTDSGSLIYYDFDTEESEVKLEKVELPNINHHTFQLSDSEDHIFVNTLGLITGKLYNTSEFMEVADIPISHAYVHDFKEGKVLFGNSAFIYYYDLNNVINSILTESVENLILRNNRISFNSKSNITLSIYDYLGNEHISREVNPGPFNMSLSNLMGGFYLITFNNGAEFQTIKYIRR